MEVEFTKEALEDLKYWKKVKDAKTQKRITSLITAILDTPFEGLGNPESLKHSLSGYWSRRISKEHRIVYKVEETKILIISLRFHY